MQIQTLKTELEKSLPNWKIKEEKLYRHIETENWTKSMAIANMISYLAEAHDHHPDLIVKYSELEISLFSHDENSITEKDLQLAQNIENFLLLESNKKNLLI